MRLHRSRLAVLVGLLLGVLCVLALSGCGGGGGGSASSAGSSQGDASGSGDGSSGGGSAQVAEFTKCLREHGVEGFGQGQVNELSEEEQAAFQSAMSACRDLAPQGGPGGFSGASSTELTKYRDCLQEHGVSGFGDAPGQGQGQGQSPADGQQPGGRAQLSDEERAKLDAAMKACASLAPQGFGRGGGFPGAGAAPPPASGNQPGADGSAASSAYRKCMSEHGVTLGEQGSVGTEAFRKATEACGKLLEQSGSGSTSP